MEAPVGCLYFQLSGGGVTPSRPSEAVRTRYWNKPRKIPQLSSQKPGTWNSVLGIRDLRTWVIFLLLCRCISRELEQKQSIWDSNLQADIGCWYFRQRLNPLHCESALVPGEVTDSLGSLVSRERTGCRWRQGLVLCHRGASSSCWETSRLGPREGTWGTQVLVCPVRVALHLAV